MSAPPAVQTCPRCRARLCQSYGEVLCLNCGTLETPRRAWDLISSEQEPRDDRRRRRKAGRDHWALTDADRAMLAGRLPDPGDTVCPCCDVEFDGVYALREHIREWHADLMAVAS